MTFFSNIAFQGAMPPSGLGMPPAGGIAYGDPQVALAIALGLLLLVCATALLPQFLPSLHRVGAGQRVRWACVAQRVRRLLRWLAGYRWVRLPVRGSSR